jgi:hypothetical protein
MKFLEGVGAVIGLILLIWFLTNISAPHMHRKTSSEIVEETEDEWRRGK